MQLLKKSVAGWFEQLRDCIILFRLHIICGIDEEYKQHNCTVPEWEFSFQYKVSQFFWSNFFGMPDYSCVA